MVRELLPGAVAACAAFVFACPAAADPPTEQQIRSAVGKAIGKSLVDDEAAGIAGCEEARGLLTPDAPAWLGFYIEQCLATVSEPGGVRGGARCPHYDKQVEIWRKHPPPIVSGEEDAAITRAKALRQAKEDYASYCVPGGAPKSINPDAMAISASSKDAVLETQEGLAYTLPAGFGVASFGPDSGVAFLRNPTMDLGVRVERKGLNDRSAQSFDYPNRETLPSGAVLQWEYKELISGSGYYALYGRVTLPEAYVMLGVSTGSKSGTKSVDEGVGLALFRKIAGSLRVVGPRCTGDCQPGVLKPS